MLNHYKFLNIKINLITFILSSKSSVGQRIKYGTYGKYQF